MRLDAGGYLYRSYGGILRFCDRKRYRDVREHAVMAALREGLFEAADRQSAVELR
jgi:hypothetical protein